MKFDFKKITSVLASVVMLGSTVGIAAAANYPAPFVAGGAANVAVVVTSGSHAGSSSDLLAAVDLGQSLQASLTEQTSSGTTTGATASGGDSIKIEKSTNKLNMNNALTDVWTTKITSSGLPNVLVDGTFRSKDNIDYSYEQYVELAGSVNWSHFADNDYKDKEPTLGIKIDRNIAVLNYTIDFAKYPRSDVDSNGRLEDLEDRDISIMGKTYKLLNAYNKSSDTKLELMRGTATATINLNEEKTVKLEDKSYTVTLTFIDATYTQFEVVDSEGSAQTTTKLAKGGTYKLNDGTQLGVTDLSYQALSGGVMNAEFTIGADKLTLENGQVLEINDEDINDILVNITRIEVDANKVDITKIRLDWVTNDELYVTPEQSAIIPGFKSIKLEAGEFTIPSEETVKVDTSGSFGIDLTIPIKDGDAKVSVLYGNATDFGWIGDDNDGTGNIKTANDNSEDVSIIFDLDTDDNFFVSWNDSTSGESYFMDITSVTEDTTVLKNYSTIKNVLSGDTYSLKKEGDIITIGNVELTMGPINKDNKEVNVSINSGGSFNRVFTKGGLAVHLPFNGSISWNPADAPASRWGEIGWADLSVDHNASSWMLWLDEEDKDGNLGSGEEINITVGHASSKSDVISVDVDSGRFASGTSRMIEEGDTEIYQGYVASDLASKLVLKQPSGSQDSAEVVYHSKEAYANVFLTAPEVTISGGGAGTGSELGSVTVKDTEVSSVQEKNLIVIGGSCINSVAAKVLDVAEGTCADDFTTATGVGANQFLVKVVDSPYATGKVAMLVAGYEAADTTKAVKYVTTETVATAVGTTLKKVTATYADVA